MNEVRRFKLIRVGAAQGQAVFTCDQLLGGEVEVVDAKDYDRLVQENISLRSQIYHHANLHN